MLNIPLMSNNINKEDIDALVNFLTTSDRFTNGPKVREFENAWSGWLGDMKHSVFVNSGASANFISMAVIRELYGPGEVILAPFGWTSDVCSVLAAGMTPVFVDVNKNNMSMDVEQAIAKMNANTKAVLMTHILGHNGMTQKLVDECHKRNIILVEDVCESHGATFKGKKCGTIGDISNFSFYYAHHMSTIEGGMICTNNKEIYRTARMMRSHGLLREADDQEYINDMVTKHQDVHAEFIFPVMGYNMRSTEINAVIGLNQIKRLDNNIAKRKAHYKLFLENLNSDIFYTDFEQEGCSNYAFVIMLKEANDERFSKLTNLLIEEGVEFRRGTAGGGNILRQPYVKKYLPNIDPTEFPNLEFIHNYGIYVGNYPDLEDEKIIKLCELLNTI